MMTVTETIVEGSTELLMTAATATASMVEGTGGTVRQRKHAQEMYDIFWAIGVFSFFSFTSHEDDNNSQQPSVSRYTCGQIYSKSHCKAIQHFT